METKKILLIQSDKINSIFQWCICNHHKGSHYLGYGICEQCKLQNLTCNHFHLEIPFKLKLNLDFESALKFLHIPFPIENDKLRWRFLEKYLKGDLI